MPDGRARVKGLDGAVTLRSPVRCSLCNLPVVRSGSDPAVLAHQIIARRASGHEAVEFFPAEGACPQEGAVIPATLLVRIPPADLDAAMS